MDLPEHVEHAARNISQLVGMATADHQQHASGQYLYSRIETLQKAIATGLMVEADFALVDADGNEIPVIEPMRESLDGVRYSGELPTDLAGIKALIVSMNEGARVRNARLKHAAEKLRLSPFLVALDGQPNAGLALRLGEKFVAYDSPHELSWQEILPGVEMLQGGDRAAVAMWSCTALPALAARLGVGEAPAPNRWIAVFKRPADVKRFPKAFRTQGLQPLPGACGLAWCSGGSTLWSKRITRRATGYHEVTNIQGEDSSEFILGDIPAHLLK